MAKTLESMKSVSIEDIDKYFATAKIIKDFMLKDGYKPTFFQNNQVLATVWERPSLRTRVSFETGFQALGGGVITLKAYPANAADIIFKEDVRDQANVLKQHVRPRHGAHLQPRHHHQARRGDEHPADQRHERHELTPSSSSPTSSRPSSRRASSRASRSPTWARARATPRRTGLSPPRASA